MVDTLRVFELKDYHDADHNFRDYTEEELASIRDLNTKIPPKVEPFYKLHGGNGKKDIAWYEKNKKASILIRITCQLKSVRHINDTSPTNVLYFSWDFY